MIHLDIYNRTKISLSPALFLGLTKRARSLLVKERRIRAAQAYSCELTFVGDRTMRQLNRTHHGKDRPTDVISLSYFQKDKDDVFAGEIFISVPFARRQARVVGQPLRDELCFLFIHGFLHVFGYDHMKPAEEEHMKSLTYKILGRRQR